MTKSSIIVIAAAFSAGIATPAYADWDHVANIQVEYNVDRDSKSPDFGGPVERLRFTARGGDIQCAFIRATFASGRIADLFTGRLAQGSSRAIDLPGEQRTIRRISTKCHAFQRSGSQIEVEADIGQYRDAWRRSPNWNQIWSRMFNWSNQPSADQMVNYWVPVTTLHFSGRGDSDGSATGWSGKSISAIGLRSSKDAKCGRVAVVFGNGQRVDLGARALSAGATARFDLPGANDRNVARLNLACHAINGSRVDIGVYGRK
jgi:hypothetical protein